MPCQIERPSGRGRGPKLPVCAAARHSAPALPALRRRIRRFVPRPAPPMTVCRQPVGSTIHRPLPADRDVRIRRHSPAASPPGVLASVAAPSSSPAKQACACRGARRAECRQGRKRVAPVSSGADIGAHRNGRTRLGFNRRSSGADRRDTAQHAYRQRLIQFGMQGSAAVEKLSSTPLT